ncbi:hypothetical protein M430DRAFT_201355 [Amorphotheca resinae ATCC 22711]|uniref:Uncharacterized protein n=1 Tax=Amorphotheca resinae ATCC 22711 TaxID=857342 RepID=A0A2T3BAP1_AMORE|nr:hypothetical protein M430DRAFT_201355 [Amorphotheca resinae ATCC 22711]PSS25368.1 hypothetical protein M430DRAFT_201355 [Amorphotheca resinae ATCC 22711]
MEVPTSLDYLCKLTFIMGKGKRHQGHKQNDKLKPSHQEGNRWDGSGDKKSLAKVHQLGSHTVIEREHSHSLDSSHHAFESNQYHRPKKSNRHPQPGTLKALSHCDVSLPRTTLGSHRNAFLARSKHFKQHLTDSIEQTLHHMQQWYPDESLGESDDDEMDWQPEGEVTIPIPGEVHYVWDPTPASPGEVPWGNGTLKVGVQSRMPIGIKKRIALQESLSEGLETPVEGGLKSGSMKVALSRGGTCVLTE